MSVRGKKAIGMYFAYFGLATSLNFGKVLGGFLMAGLILFMIAIYPVYLHDRRDYENSTFEK